MNEGVAIVGVGWAGFRQKTPDLSYKELMYEAACIAYARRRNVLAAVLSGLSFAPLILCFLLLAILDVAWFAQNGGLAPFGN